MYLQSMDRYPIQYMSPNFKVFKFHKYDHTKFRFHKYDHTKLRRMQIFLKFILGL